MNVITTAIEGVIILEPQVFGDARGVFMESFKKKAFSEAAAHEVVFVQDNHSRSSKDVLRGLHYQAPPHAQRKLVRVTHGSAYDVAVDVLRGGTTVGRWVDWALEGASTVVSTKDASAPGLNWVQP